MKITSLTTHKLMNMDRIRSYITLFVCGQIFLSLALSCSFGPKNRRMEADRQLRTAYANRYKNLDRCLLYADSAYHTASRAYYKQGVGKALNLKAFYMMSKMRYAEADSLLSEAMDESADNLTRLCTEISYMRLCQRRSLNKDFYFHRYNAERIIKRIQKNPRVLSDKDRMYYTYCKSEYGIILSAYFYYVGREADSEKAIRDITADRDIHIESDTAQWLAYLYNTNELELCKYIAKRSGYIFWEANAKQAECEQMMENAGDSALCLKLASEALDDFMRYGNTYQIAAAWRTMADAYGRQQDYANMLNSLLIALNDTLVYQSPTIVASINERLCLAYSVHNNKLLADITRNEFLDIQDTTRQDRQLEARADAMETKVSGLRTLCIAIVILTVGMVVTAILMVRNRKRKGFDKRLAKKTAHLEELEDERNMLSQQISDAMRVAVEQHAKISLVHNMQPLIDRMAITGQKIDSDEGAKEYLGELCATVEEGNALLTRWIQLRKGNIKLHVETFLVQELFDIVMKSSTTFASKGVTLTCEPTDMRIRADRVLTFFLINTLVDNARKYTQQGGTVTLRCGDSDVEGYADISVSDTGEGMPQEAADHLFEYRVIKDDGGEEDLLTQRSHGFGLMNCRGIIDRYRKTSSLFEHARINAVSEVGQGTKVTFTLPKVLRVLVVAVLMAGNAFAQGNKASVHIDRASDFADSMYISNISGRYDDCLRYADSCRSALNAYYLTLPEAKITDTLRADDGEAEVRWLKDSVKVEYDVILAMRNESAVAAMALHQWRVYEVNNKAYRQLYKDFTTDNSLDEYCQRMETYEGWMRLAFVVLIILIACTLWFFYSQYVRYYVKARNDIDDVMEERRNEIEVLKAECNRLHVSNSVADNCLSTIKHETMYYPSRINYLISADADKAQLCETIAYYQTLYGLLTSHCHTLQQAVPLKLSHLPWSDFAEECRGIIELRCDVPTLTLIAHKDLLRYVFLLLRRKNGAPVVIDRCAVDDQYVRLNAVCEGISPEKTPPALMFGIQTPDPDYLIIRQIIREFGDGALRYASGIAPKATSRGMELTITLPILKT